MKSKWPDFLFTVAIRFTVGLAIGGSLSIPILFLGKRKSPLVELIQSGHSRWVILWFGFWGLAGGIIALLTTPRWQTPWYKRDSITLNSTEDLESPNLVGHKAGFGHVRKSVSIRTISADGKQHEYSSMAEVPPEIALEIEALEKEVTRQKGEELTVIEDSHLGNSITSKTIHQKDVSVYKIIDDSGVEQTYHSIEDMPAEIRAAIVKAEKEAKQ